MNVSRWLQRRVWGCRLLIWWYGNTWRIRHPVEAYHGWRFRRWLHTPDGERYYRTMNWIVNNVQTTTLHELSADVAAKWAEPEPE